MSDVILSLGSFAASLYYTAVRIHTAGEDGEGSGTGCICLYQAPGAARDHGMPVLVTNRHVVQGSETGLVIFMRAVDPELSAAHWGKKFALGFTDFQNCCFFHPDASVDLALLPLIYPLYKAEKEQGVHLFMRSITRDVFADPERIDAIEDVYMVGFPNGLMDEVNHLPVVRKGVTATPWHADYEGRREFLVDISVFPGSSGSPIFVCDSLSTSKRHGMFLGILSSGYYRTTQNEIIQAAVNRTGPLMLNVTEMLDLGIVIKSSVVAELIDLWAKSVGCDQPDPTSSDNTPNANLPSSDSGSAV